MANALVHLNVETFSHHAAVDRFWLELVMPGHRPTRVEYTQHLIRAYGFEAPVEAAIAYTPRFAEHVELGPRYRAGLIARDLMTLGLVPAEVSAIPQCMIAPFATIGEALGWLYVLQRATLIHDHVRRELALRGPRLTDSMAYLGAFAGSAGAHWDEFGLALDRVARTDDERARVIAAATEGFRTATAWLTANPQRD